MEDSKPIRWEGLGGWSLGDRGTTRVVGEKEARRALMGCCWWVVAGLAVGGEVEVVAAATTSLSSISDELRESKEKSFSSASTFPIGLTGMELTLCWGVMGVLRNRLVSFVPCVVMTPLVVTIIFRTLPHPLADVSLGEGLTEGGE